jgi:hypothetical protein
MFMPRSTAFLAGIATLAALLASPGCTIAASTDVKSSGISAFYDVQSLQSTADRVSVTASFKVGSTVLDLIGGDTVSCDGVTLTRNKDALGNIEYRGSVPKKGVGERYAFEFKRSGESFVSTVGQPDTIAPIAPAVGSDVLRTTRFEVQWDKATPRTTVSVSEPGCVSSAGIDGSNKTSVAFEPNSLTFSGSPISCPKAQIAISRSVAGVGSEGLKSVDIVATNTAYIGVVARP